MKIRQKDIAEMVGVSLTTVSLVLNNKPSRISQSKKEEIWKIAEKYDYIPNYHAKSLATNTSNVIGIIVPNIENPFFASIVKSFEQKLLEDNYVTLIMNSNDNKKNDLQLINELNKFNIDGLIAIFSNSLLFDTDQLKHVLGRINCPYVVIDRPTGLSTHPEVIFNNKLGGYIATEHLIKLGHKNIGTLMANQTLINSKSRYKGYLEALNDYSIKPKEDYYVETKITFEEGYINSESLLLNDDISAIFAVNDLVALGAMKKAKELSIRIPDDMSIVGYDNLIFNSYIDTTLTSVHQEIKLMVDKSLQLLFDDNSTIKKITLDPTLCLGESTTNI